MPDIRKDFDQAMFTIYRRAKSEANHNALVTSLPSPPDSNEKQNAPKNNSNEPPCCRVVDAEPLSQCQKTKFTGIGPAPPISTELVEIGSILGVLSRRR